MRKHRLNPFVWLLGIASLLPLAWTLAIPVSLFFDEDAGFVIGAIASMVVARAMPFILVLLLVLIGYYLYLLFHRRLPDSERTMWTLLLLLWSPFGIPAFWYRFFWSKAPVSDQTDSPQDERPK